MRSQSIEFKVAEKVLGSSNTVSSDVGRGYGVVNKERRRRLKSDGEYSYMTSMPGNESDRELLSSIRQRFADNEVKVTDPTRKGELSGHIDEFSNSIDNFENLRLNVVRAREFMPSTSGIDKEKWEKEFRDEWEIFAPEMGLNYDSRMFLSGNAKKTLENSITLAQSLARLKGKEKVTEKEMKRTQQMFEDQAERLVEHPVMKNAQEKRREVKEKDRKKVFRDLLKGSGLSEDQLWELIKSEGIFNDRARFEDAVHELEKDGLIFRHKDGKIEWA